MCFSYAYENYMCFSYAIWIYMQMNNTHLMSMFKNSCGHFITLRITFPFFCIILLHHFHFWEQKQDSECKEMTILVKHLYCETLLLCENSFLNLPDIVQRQWIVQQAKDDTENRTQTYQVFLLNQSCLTITTRFDSCSASFWFSLKIQKRCNIQFTLVDGDMFDLACFETQQPCLRLERAYAIVSVCIKVRWPVSQHVLCLLFFVCLELRCHLKFESFQIAVRNDCSWHYCSFRLFVL